MPKYVQKFQKEFIKAGHAATRTHAANTLHRSETSSVAEQSDVQGTATEIIQSGFPEEWGGRWIVIATNVCEKMADGKTTYDRKFGVALDGLVIPLGANVSHKTTSSPKLSHGCVSSEK